MEIERKFLIKEIPDNIEQYECWEIEQAYLCTDPVIRIRKKNQDYILTYKSQGLMAREEVELPLNAQAYAQLLNKVDGRIITKKRYLIPTINQLTIELDIFSGELRGLILAEVEFPDLDTANTYKMPAWFKEDVTYDKTYHNSNLSKYNLVD